MNELFEKPKKSIRCINYEKSKELKKIFNAFYRVVTDGDLDSMLYMFDEIGKEYGKTLVEFILEWAEYNKKNFI